MKREIVLVASLVASLAVGAAAQTKVKPGVGPGRGTGVGHGKPVSGAHVSPTTSAQTGDATAPASEKPVQTAPDGHGSGTGANGSTPARGR